MSHYQITDPILLDIDLDLFEYNPGKTILTNIRQKIHNIVRPGVEQGQVVAILGVSGIGKSTLFELIAGLQKPTKGSIKAYSKEHNQLMTVETGMVGMIYQSYDLYPFLMVKSQLALGARKGGLEGNAATEKIKFLADHFKLTPHLNKYPNELSGGQRQRVAIAQQLLCSNTILLMDEPFSGLDPIMKNNICDLIRDITILDELQTIIIVSHDIEPTLSIADTVWLMGKAESGGATVVESINLAEKGIAWQKNILDLPEFQQMVNYVNHRFVSVS